MLTHSWFIANICEATRIIQSAPLQDFKVNSSQWNWYSRTWLCFGSSTLTASLARKIKQNRGFKHVFLVLYPGKDRELHHRNEICFSLSRWKSSWLLFDSEVTVVSGEVSDYSTVCADFHHSIVALQLFLGDEAFGNRRNPWRETGFRFQLGVQVKCLIQIDPLFILAYSTQCLLDDPPPLHPSVLSAVLGDVLPPVATVFPEDVEEFASQARLPWFNQALGVDHQSAGLPVLMTSYHIFKSWRRERMVTQYVKEEFQYFLTWALYL